MHMYKNSETEKKIDELMSKMTLSEKIGQLQQIGPSPVGGFEISDEDALAMFRSGKITGEAYESIISHTMLDKREDNIRRGEVGSFIGIDDAELSNHLQRIAVEESRLGIPLIMGMDVIHGHKTIFPIPLAQACSFDEKTFEQSAAVADFALCGFEYRFDFVVGIERDLFLRGAGNIYYELRVASHDTRGVRQLRAGAFELRQELHRGELTVAGSREVAEYDVT